MTQHDADLFRELRTNSGLTTKEFASRLGIGKSTMFRLEADPTAIKLSHILAYERLSLTLAIEADDPTIMFPRVADEVARLTHKPVSYSVKQKEETSENYHPLIVEVCPNQQPGRENEFVTFIEGQLCFFDKHYWNLLPPVGGKIEVMISNVLWKRHPITNNFDFTKVVALMLRPITDDLALVAHDGFILYDANYTKANALNDQGYNIGILSAGRRLMHMAKEETNEKPIPGKVWVSKFELGSKGTARVEGVARIDDLNSNILNALKLRTV